jgi:alkylation response protein AidB-like acyl-CoA dehydrogenase
LAVEGLYVPAELFVNPVRSEPCHDGPRWRFPLFANLNVSIMGFPLGVARRALDEFTELARTKTRGPERSRLADDRHVQLQLAIAEGGLQATRAFAFDVIGELWDTACAGDPLSLDQRTRLSLAANRRCAPRWRRWTASSGWPGLARSTPISRSSAASATSTRSMHTSSSAPTQSPATPSTGSGFHNLRSTFDCKSVAAAVTNRT